MATLDELRREYEAGATIYELSERYSVGAAAIYKRLKKAGTTLRPAGRPRSAGITDLVVRLKGGGLLHKQIAYEVGLTPAAVCNRLIRAGHRTYKRAEA